MIRINLIPPEYAAKQAKKELNLLLGSSGIVVCGLLIGYWFIKFNQAKELQIKISSAENDLSRYQSIISQIESIEANKQQLVSKRDVIRNLNRSRLLYPVLFEDLLPIVPSDVWLTNIQISDKSEGNMQLNLSAKALSNFALATWLTNLQQSPHFTGVELSPISYGNESTGQTLTFNINCGYRHQGAFPLSEFN